MNSTAIEETIARACDPRVGDRITGPGSSHVTEVTAIIPLNDKMPSMLDIKFSLTGSDAEYSLTLPRYQWMARVAIESGETFHALEDDEE